MSYLAEQNIIGSLLMDVECMSEIYNLLSPEMFTSELFGRIYHEFQRGYDNHYDVNAVVIEQKLRSDNFPSQLLIEEIQKCVINTTTSATVKTYANIVVSDYKAKRLDDFLGKVKVTPNNIESQIRAISEELELLRKSVQINQKHFQKSQI